MKAVYLSTGILFSLAIVFIIWYFLFNIYEVKVIAGNKGFVEPGGSVKVKIFGINSLGKKIPTVKIKSKIEFIAGKELVKNITENSEGFKLKLAESTGEVKLKIRGKYFLAPSVVELKVKKNRKEP